MTPGVIAAHQAADRHDTEEGFVELPYDRDLYVKAFLQGYAQAQKDAMGPVQAPPKFHLEDEG